jgi:hypothetical protein
MLYPLSYGGPAPCKRTPALALRQPTCRLAARRTAPFASAFLRVADPVRRALRPTGPR